MHCPQCGTKQVNNEVRFCSRCGFQLGVVTDLLANKGVLPPHLLPVQPPPMMPPISSRKKGMKNGAKLMFLSAVLTPIFFGLAVGPFDSPGPLVIPFTVFLAGLCWLVYAAIFGEDNPVPQVQNFQQPFGANLSQPFGANPQRTALPSADNFQVTGTAPQRITTSEIINPPSVTDHTTQLFDKE